MRTRAERGVANRPDGHPVRLGERGAVVVGQRKWTILIVEDHTLLRAALRGLLEHEPDFEVSGEAKDGGAAVRLVAHNLPDIVLMDLHMPGCNGMEAIATIKRRHPKSKILVLTAYRDREYVAASLRAGADGYLLKTAAAQELTHAVRQVLAGHTYLAQEVAHESLASVVASKDESSPEGALEKLTHRERQVLQLIAEGRSNKFIAGYLFLSEKTVDKHRTNLMKKLDIHNVSALTSFAIAARVILGYGDPELQLQLS